MERALRRATLATNRGTDLRARAGRSRSFRAACLPETPAALAERLHAPRRRLFSPRKAPRQREARARPARCPVRSLANATFLRGRRARYRPLAAFSRRRESGEPALLNTLLARDRNTKSRRTRR